ncbi:adenosylcobinamide-GDP ribazoletransferase [Sulfolobaceae archaeon RB850M]|jgi:adenosylcobinamide-GDP ribazoletransferase|nr:adenosylcobinamide-GDP ribazoletransferase [Sulfolobaceae archaeon]
MRVLKGILAQISFFTIIPSVRNVTLEEIANYAFLSPFIVGFITGVIDYFFLKITYHILGTTAFLLLIPEVEIIRGFHHLDGLLDLGDALMIRDYEKRLKALHDVQIGAGGIGLLLVYVTLFIVAVLNFNLSIWPLISAEILSRVDAILLLGTIKPIRESYLGKVFHERIGRKWVITLILSVFFFPLSIFFFLLFLATLAVYSLIALKVLRGSSGDLAGAVITLSFPIYLLGLEKSCSYYFISLLLSTFH